MDMLPFFMLPAAFLLMFLGFPVAFCMMVTAVLFSGLLVSVAVGKARSPTRSINCYTNEAFTPLFWTVTTFGWD